jgi:hypothetical protein
MNYLDFRIANFLKKQLIFFLVAPRILKSTQFTHSPTNALFINLVKSFKFTLKYTIISLLHVSVFNGHHQGDLSVPSLSYIYVKTLSKITSLYQLGDVAACVLCAVQSETVERHVCCVQCRVRL